MSRFAVLADLVFPDGGGDVGYGRGGGGGDVGYGRGGGGGDVGYGRGGGGGDVGYGRGGGGGDVGYGRGGGGGDVGYGRGGGGGDVGYGRGGGGGVARGRYGEDVLFYLRHLFPDQVFPTGGDDEQVGGDDGGPGVVDVEGACGDGVVKKRTRKTYVPRVYDVGSRVPVVAPFHLNEEVIPFPPFRIRNIRDAKKAAADAKSGSYGNATISHGSYGEGGNLKFY